MRSVFGIFILVAGLIRPSTYDPVKLLPDSYSLQFENERVKIVRVRYAAHAKLPAHAHTAYASAYVYLNDAGPGDLPPRG
jgi:quercetin dioxygenase-like cupin family protein